MKMCHKRGLRMVWNSVMRKKNGIFLRFIQTDIK